MNVDKDAFSSGQIQSKIWLCEELEKLYEKIDTVWIYGGWYGLSAFLLQSRKNIDIKCIRSFDIDSDCEKIADLINENWVINNWQFKAITKDCSSIDFDKEVPDLIINTSTEHFDNLDWWYNIPKGVTVALQGNNMLHDDHVIHFKNLESFLETFPLSTMHYKGQLDFHYPTWNFTRFMVIGEK